MEKVIIIPPDGNGSKGDEAMLRGVINLYHGVGEIEIYTPRKQYWKEWIIDKCCSFQEKYVPLEKLADEITDKCKLVIIGADIMDGIFDTPSVSNRLDAAKKAIKLGGTADVVSCSFRDKVSPSIINEIVSIGESLKWYLRDNLSRINFEQQTGLKGNYFPDLAFQCERIVNSNVERYRKEIVRNKKDHKFIVALNLNEHSFRGAYQEANDNNRKEYVAHFMKSLLEVFEDAYFVLISHDIRHWENHWSDMQYLELCSQYLEECGKKDGFLVIDEYSTEIEILSILEEIDIVISGRMHLIIAAIRNGCLPIAYFGEKGSYHNILKFKGMMMQCIGRCDLVVNDLSSLCTIIKLIVDQYQEIKQNCNKHIELYLKTVKKSTEEFYIELKSNDDEETECDVNEMISSIIKRYADKDEEIRELQKQYNDQYWDLLNEKKILSERMEDIAKNNLMIEQLNLYIKEQENKIQEQKGKVQEQKEESQKREEQLTECIKKQEKEIQKQIKRSEEQKEQIGNLEILVKKMEKQNQNEQQNMYQQILDLKQEVLNKEGHIQLLLPPEREYKKIINSKMFKIMRFCCRTFDIVIFIPKIIMKKGIAFIRLLSHVNVPKLKIAWGYVKEEGIQDAYHHLMRDYHQGELKKIEVKVEEKVYDEITCIQECSALVIPETDDPVVSIVIPAYNQFTYTYYCIKSIIENSGDVAYEIILADDCSNDLTTEILKVVKNLIVARTEKNLLFLRNCNNAAKQARGKYILFLNNDTQVQKDWLRPLIDLCEKDKSIGLVGSKLVYADGTLQEAGGIIWRDGSGWNYGRNDDAMKPEYNYVREVDYLSGASIMIPRALWEMLGGFDEHFAPAYCEDSDLAFQVRTAGYRVVYQPLSVVTHFEGKSNGTDVTTGIKKYQVENSLKLQEKWKLELQKQESNGQKVFKARERSLNKKVVLVIDHYVPHYDKDAGSKTTFQYLKMFVQQGYSVKFIGDNFYQHEPYTTVLQQLGIEVLYGPWYAQNWQEWILANKNYIDFAYLNRPHITMKYIDFLKEKTDIKCIYYGHDLHFLRLQREYELSGDEKKLVESKEWMEKELYIMRKADISYYPSYVEEQEIHKIDSKIPVKAITAYVYEEFLSDIAMDFTKREGIMFVGGFGHPPNEDAVLWFVENVYPLIEKEKKIPFYIVGSNPTDKIKKLQSKNIIVKGFVSEEELRELYNTCKLVVVPLRYGAGVKGKVVEALYYGTPMVTTSVGAEGIEGADKIIDIADTAENFAEDVLKLYNNDKQLVEKSEQYQVFVKNKFGTEAVWNIIAEDFK